MNTRFKVCIRCDVRKREDGFDKNYQMKDGRVNTCKKCRLGLKHTRVAKVQSLDINAALMKWGRE